MRGECAPVFVVVIRASAKNAYCRKSATQVLDNRGHQLIIWDNDDRFFLEINQTCDI